MMCTHVQTCFRASVSELRERCALIYKPASPLDTLPPPTRRRCTPRTSSTRRGSSTTPTRATRRCRPLDGRESVAGTSMVGNRRGNLRRTAVLSRARGRGDPLAGSRRLPGLHPWPGRLRAGRLPGPRSGGGRTPARARAECRRLSSGRSVRVLCQLSQPPRLQGAAAIACREISQERAGRCC